jgi:hypothetical protein
MQILCINFVQKRPAEKRFARFEIFAKLFLKIHVFRDVTLCFVVSCFRRLKGT